MLVSIPFIHTIKLLIRLVNRQHRPLGQDIQLCIGHDGCDFNNTVVGSIEPGHFQINPDQVVGV